MSEMIDSIKDEENVVEAPPSVTFGQHLFDELKILMDPYVSVSQRIEQASLLMDHVSSIDAYVTISGHSGQTQWPAMEWKRTCGKAYSLLMWVRPRILDKLEDQSAEEKQQQVRSIWYRIGNHPDDSQSSTGVCVSGTPWRVTADPSGNSKDGQRYLETILTAYSLPHNRPSQVNYSNNPTYSSWVRVPLTLVENTWHLVAFTHKFPYLQRPTWSVLVDGKLQGTGELDYPTTATDNQVLDCCSSMHNLTSKGVQIPVAGSTKRDDQKTASELATPTPSQHFNLALDFAAIALYSASMPPTVLAILSDAGPNLALQEHGRIVTTLPPVANWSKGSSLEGPKVGIPLNVHAAAMEIQQLADTIVWAASPTRSRVLGASGDSTRVLWTLKPVAGTTAESPRVGLIQPAPPMRIPDDELPYLYTTGSVVSLQHALSQYLLLTPNADRITSDLQEWTQNWSVVLVEQGFGNVLLLPFFLSLCPPSHIFQLQQELYVDSLKQLYALWSNDGALAASLIRLLSTWIGSGGGRVQEEVLQSGTLHVLASCLRQSLLRAIRLKLFREKPSSQDDFIRRCVLLQEEPALQHRQEGSSPSYMPSEVIDSCVDLISNCCGPAATRMEELMPCKQIRRASDLALTALFGFAFDIDLWGSTPSASRAVMKCVAERYGGTCQTYGYILRSQMSVQQFLDSIRLRLDSLPRSEDLEQTGIHLSQILLAMLRASLSNRRSISQGEYDIAACVGALSDSPLGSIGAHVILFAFVHLLVWCETLPFEAAAIDIQPTVDEEQKMQVASRLGRNMLVAQFHDVVAPMLLSRTVFSGERTMVPKSQSSFDDTESKLSWQSHWRLSLLLFSWLASLAGPEGLIAAKCSGSLMQASGLAGSLNGALDGESKEVVASLFLPPPGMALMIGSTLRSEWKYTDLLADRLQIMVPLLPGMVISVLRADNSCDQHKRIPVAALTVLCDLLMAAGGAFHRVYGGTIHSTEGTKRQLKSRRDGFSQAMKAAKSYVPFLLVVAMMIENSIPIAGDDEDTVLSIARPRFGVTYTQKRRTDSDSWVDVSSSSSEAFVSEEAVAVPPGFKVEDPSALSAVLHSCQRIVLNTIAGLISNAMNIGGAGTAVSLWQSIVVTLQGFPSAKSSCKTSGGALDEGCDKVNIAKLDDNAEHVLCRVISNVITKALRRDPQWEVWDYELASGIARVCQLVEERELIPHRENSSMNIDRTSLLYVLLEVLVYGREATGWCQLALPTAPFTRDQKRGGDVSAASKLLLPVLQPCFRVVLGSLHAISTKTRIVTREPGVDQTAGESESLFKMVLDEVEATSTAAVVGLSFFAARDVALSVLATIRKLIAKIDDQKCQQLCQRLFVKLVEELHVRYDGERRLREKAIFDAYDGKGSNATAAAESQAFERLILGGEILEQSRVPQPDEISQEASSTKQGPASVALREDFVLFHDPKYDPTDVDNPSSKLGYAEYEGLGAALDACQKCSRRAEHDPFSEISMLISSFLDAWDRSIASDEEVSDFVRTFDFTMRLGKDQSLAQSEDLDMQAQNPIFGSETAADAMSTFFEFAAVEKSRLKEIVSRSAPSHRYSRMSYSDRYCWARMFELSDQRFQETWERGVPDGNRDIRSRLPTYPSCPQFRRYIPKYLDNSSGFDSDKPSQLTHKISTGPAEMDAFTKALLKTANLEIVDITKKQDTQVEDPDLEIRDPADSLIEDEDGMYVESEYGGERPAQGERENTQQDDKPEPVQEENVTDEDQVMLDNLGAGKGHHTFTTSAFATPPDNSTSSLSLMHSAAAGMIEQHLDNCLHVKPEGSRHCTMLLSSSYLILEYEGNPEGYFEGEVLAVQDETDRTKMLEETGGSKEPDPDEKFLRKNDRRVREVALLRPKSMRWNTSEISHVYLRRYRLRDTALEIFFIPSGGTSFGGYGLFSPSSSLFIDFGPGREGTTRRDDAAFAIMKRAPPQAMKQWPDASLRFLHEQISRLTIGWAEGRITNFDYLLHLNMLAGRSYNDICQYPVFPWVLADYTSEDIPDLTDKSNFRDLSKPVGALNPERLQEFLERFNTFADPSIPPFMYGSHYSTSAGVVLHFLVRLHPYSGLHRQLQGGHFDVADRLFSSVQRTWSMCTGSSAAEVKELTPEWYCNPSFLKNSNKFKLGTSQDGEVLDDVVLPPWAKESPEKFVDVMRNALESDICSNMLPDWIDLIFGYKQQGPDAIEANNVFFYLTYYGSVDVASIEDEGLRQATELQIAHFGQCPMQLFRRPHVRRIPKIVRRLTFYQVISSHHSLHGDMFTMGGDERQTHASDALVKSRPKSGEPVFLPFYGAPLSNWVHLDAPPPGPHAPLIAVRFAGIDRCLAIDSKGVLHSFRWTWRAEEQVPTGTEIQMNHDLGCFVAQRDLHRFVSIPRLMHSPNLGCNLAVAISKTLFAGKSLLLVLSDGDGMGGLGMHLVDPAKGQVRGEVLISNAHSARITCISTDPIGTAAGHGGVGGELALVGSMDGSMSLWRFMSSHYLPMRPRARISGHGGAKISAVALCATMNIAASISSNRCCISSIGNGTIIRSFPPPTDALDIKTDGVRVTTRFADTPALAISVQGFIITVCETKIESSHADGVSEQTVITLHLYTVEGTSLGSKPIERWRGIPKKILSTPDGTAALVCCGRGVTIHRLSACQPLEFLDEWHITESEDLDETIPAAWDLDLGPSLNRPVVAAAACSGGALRLHALPGISLWSERHKKSGLSQTVGNALAQPARRLNRAVRDGLGLGRQLAGMGRDIGREVSSDVKERGVGGFLGNMVFRKNSGGK